MALPPIVLGLTICRDVVIDPISRNYSVIRSFSGMPVAEFPGPGEPFRVFAVLAGGHGEVNAELLITWFGEEEIVEYARVRPRLSFPDPLQVLQCVFPFEQFPFPGPGVFLFTLFLNGEWAAHQTLRVYQKQENP